MVPADSRKISRVPRYSGAASPIYTDFGYGPFTLCGSTFQYFLLSVSIKFVAVLLPRSMPCDIAGLGCCAFARHYLHNHCCFLFLRLMRCFSSPGSLHALRGVAIACNGLPHSEIHGSTGICPLPWLIAACHVLRRLQEPRHPSCALLSFPFSFALIKPFIWFVGSQNISFGLVRSLVRVLRTAVL